MTKKHRSGIIIPVLLSVTLVAGCASSGVQVGGESRDEFKKVDLANSEFILGVGDSVEIVVYKQDDLKRTIKIDSSGKIMFPLIGDVQAAGKSIFKLRDELKERFSTYLVDPQVTVSVTGVQSQKMLILGEVKNPGVFPLDASFTLTEAIAKAGGLTTDANQGNVTLIRRGKEKPQIYSFSFKDVWKNGDVASDIPVQSGDIIYATTKPIANMSRFMQYIGSILSPVVTLEGGIILWPQVVDVVSGKRPATGFSITTP